MILIDGNLLLYATIKHYVEHEAAGAWLDEQVELGVRIGIPWQSLLAFLRISTNPKLFPNPLTIDAAQTIVEGWLGRPGFWIPNPTERHSEIFGRLAREVKATGNLITDAHLATLAIEHGLELCTCDYDFARFKGLRWSNPLKRS